MRKCEKNWCECEKNSIFSTIFDIRQSRSTNSTALVQSAVYHNRVFWRFSVYRSANRYTGVFGHADSEFAIHFTIWIIHMDLWTIWTIWICGHKLPEFTRYKIDMCKGGENSESERHTRCCFVLLALSAPRLKTR